MKFKGYWWYDTPLARKISPAPTSVDDAVFIPQARTTSFRKLPCKDPNQVPRECEFEVEGWLADKPEFKPFKPL